MTRVLTQNVVLIKPELVELFSVSLLCYCEVVESICPPPCQYLTFSRRGRRFLTDIHPHLGMVFGKCTNSTFLRLYFQTFPGNNKFLYHKLFYSLHYLYSLTINNMLYLHFQTPQVGNCCEMMS